MYYVQYTLYIVVTKSPIYLNTHLALTEYIITYINFKNDIQPNIYFFEKGIQEYINAFLYHDRLLIEIVHYIMSSVQYMVYNVHLKHIVHIVQCTTYIVRYTMYNSIQYTLYII